MRFSFNFYLLKSLGSMPTDIKWAQVLEDHVVHQRARVAQKAIRVRHYQFLQPKSRIWYNTRFVVSFIGKREVVSFTEKNE